MRIGKKSYLEFHISEVDRELKAVSREIRLLERCLRRERRSAGYGFPRVRAGEGRGEDREAATRRRLASYLSTGAFQTIAHPKFRSDLVRRRRLLLAGAAIALLAAAWIILRTVL